MANPGTTCNVTGDVETPGTLSAVGGTLEFRLNRWDVGTAQIIVPVIQTAVVGTGGSVDIDLWRNVNGDANSWYQVTWISADGLIRLSLGQINVPDSASADLRDLLANFIASANMTPTLLQRAEQAAQDAEDAADLAFQNANDSKVYASEAALLAVTVTSADNGTWARVLHPAGMQAWLVVSGSWDFQRWLKGPSYDDVATFFAASDTFSDDTIVVTRNGGFAYKALAAAATGSVANAGGQDFEVLPGPDGKWYLDAFGLLGDGSDETTKFQNAIDAVPRGGTLKGGRKTYTVSTLDFGGVHFEGADFYREFRGPFGAAQYADDSLFSGTIIRVTATTGNTVTVGLGGNDYTAANLRDVMFIGPGSGTSTGLYCHDLLSADWQNVQVANFSTGIDFDWFEDCTFTSLRVSGCEVGINSANTANNQNVFINPELNRCDIAISLSNNSALNQFLGGVIQGGATAPTHDHSIVLDGAFNNTFSGIWFEHNVDNAVIEIVNGAGQNKFYNNRFGSYAVTIDIQDGGRTEFVGNLGQSGSVTVDIAAASTACSFINNEGFTINDSSTAALIIEDTIISAHELLMEFDRGQGATGADKARMKSSGVSTSREYHWSFLDAAEAELASLTTNNQANLNLRVGTTDQHSWLFDGRYTAEGRIRSNSHIEVSDGISTPPTAAGFASIFVDTADGDLKVRFGDGTVKTIVTDT